MFGGGLAIPLDVLPWAPIADLLPTGALVSAMSQPVLAVGPLLVLLVWGIAGTLLAGRFFRWES